MAYLNRQILTALNHAASTEETRYYLRGVYVQFRPDGSAIYVATDGQILACAFDPAPESPSDNEVEREPIEGAYIIASEDIKSIKLGARERVPYTPCVARNGKLELPLLGRILTPIDGSFPDWRRAIPNPAGSPAAKIKPLTLTPEKPAFYAPGLIARMDKIREGLTGEKTAAGALIIWHDAEGNGPAWVPLKASGDVEAFGILMPMRGRVAEDDRPAKPAWAQ